MDEALSGLNCGAMGLSSAEARQRQSAVAGKSPKRTHRTSSISLFFSQFKSPIILILLFAVGLSFFLKDITNACIILAIVFISGFLGFWQENGAADAVEKLIAIIQVKAAVLRDGKEVEIPVEEIVPGDVIALNAGDVIPGDSLLLESNNLFLNEAALTGETFPVEKTVGVVPTDTPIAKRTNTIFTGTYVANGTGKAVVMAIGDDTEFGRVSQSLKVKPPETDFEHGIRHFGFMLMEVTLLMVISIFAINVYLHRPVLDSFLFALALAVGLTPQLLPAIISVNLSHGAKRMAEAKVIVKRLEAIENFGSMNILCSDKTGTLTVGEVKLDSCVDVEGNPNEKVLQFAQLNAHFQTGYTNPIDAAILEYRPLDPTGYEKLDEEPYDFVRKRLSVLVLKDGKSLIVTKGALSNVLSVCTKVETTGGGLVDVAERQDAIQKKFEEFMG